VRDDGGEAFQLPIAQLQCRALLRHFALHPQDLGRVVDGAEDRFGIDTVLGQVVVSARPERGHGQLLVPRAGEHHERGAAHRIRRAAPGDELQAGHVGKVIVDHHAVQRLRGEPRDRFFPGFLLDHHEAAAPRALQVAAQNRAILRRIVDQEHPQRGFVEGR